MTTPQLITSFEVDTWTNDQISPRHSSLEHGDTVLSYGSQQEEQVAQGRRPSFWCGHGEWEVRREASLQQEGRRGAERTGDESSC